MSSFFAVLASLAFFATLYFAYQMVKRRPKSGRRMASAFLAAAVLSVLGSSTQTGAEREAAEVSRQAEAQQRDRDGMRRASELQAEQKQRAADQVARDEAEATRKANTSIEPAAMQIYCEREARTRLKLPDTARFPGFLEKADNQPAVGPQGATWRSWVEGENAFGGKVRDQFICIYTKSDNTISLDFQQ